MEVKQIKTLVNQVTKEVLGTEAIQLEDLTGVVELGNAVFNSGKTERYTKTLIDHIGKMVFVDRVYEGRAPSVLMDGWEYGSVLEKIRIASLPEATENSSWDLTDGQVYEQDTFTKPNVEVKFYDGLVTFEVPISITDKQLKSAFDNETQLNAFLSMIYTSIYNSMNVKIDALVMRTINNMIGEVMWKEHQNGIYNDKSTPRAVNLLLMYNKETGSSLKQAEALKNMDFLKYAAKVISQYTGRMSSLSTLFNINQKENFTPNSKLHLVLLDEFSKSANTYLQSSVYHNELTKLPEYEEISFWQGSGLNYELDAVSRINVKTSGAHTVNTNGIIGVAFDRDALGVNNKVLETTSHYNARAQFTNYWFKYEARYFNDLNENFVVFYMSDPVVASK